MKSSWTVPLLAILACWLWSSAFAVIKIGLEYMTPVTLAGLRFMLAGLILIPFCGNPQTFLTTVRTHIRTILLVSLFQTFILYGLFFTAMNMVEGALAAIVHGASPLISVIVAHFAMPDDKITPKKGLSLLLGMIGIGIIAFSRKPWSTPEGYAELTGYILLLLVCVSSAIGNVIVARDRKNISPLHLNTAQIFLGGLGLFVLARFMPAPYESLPAAWPPWPFFRALAWLVMISAAGFSIWFYLLKRPDVKVSDLSIWKFIMPVGGAILSWVLLKNESASLPQVAGMLCVALGIILANVSLKKAPAAV